MINILIVEDNEKINNMLANRCKSEGYNVFQTFNAEDGLNIFANNDINIVLTDLMLPNMQGEELVKEIRKVSDCFIIMTTAKTKLEDKLNGLNIGADDYLVKPFSFDELIIKVKRYIMRNKTIKSDIMTFNRSDLIFIYDNNIIKINGNDVELTSREYLVFKVLVDNINKVLTREQILDKVSSVDDDVYDRVIDVYIKNIRKKIRIYSDFDYIKTVYGLGYRFDGEADSNEK